MAAGDFKNGSGLVGSVLAQGQLLTTGTTPVYGPVPSNTYVKIAKVVLSNTTASGVTVSYGAVKAGGTVNADATLQGKDVPLGAKGTSTATIDATELEGIMLGPGDSIGALASAGTAITYTISGAVSA